jgi:hypothetical protein
VFFVPGATAPSLWVTYGSGPAKGDTVNVQVNNLDPAVSASVEVLMLQVSRVYTVDRWGFDNIIDASLPVPGNTLAGLPNDNSSVGQLSNTAVAASASVFYLFGMHNGPVGFGLWASVGSLSTLEFGVGVPQMDGYAGNAYLYRKLGPPSNVLINCPHTPLLVLLHNTATASMTVNVTATAGP